MTLVIVVMVTALVLWLRAEPGDPPAARQSDSQDPGCGPVLREPTDGAGAHLDGPIPYDAAPPSFGDHADRWEVRALPFYGPQDRPEVPVLVHNLEHGYNILWYDHTVLDDDQALAHVEVIAHEYASTGRSPDPAEAFIAAPWTPEDGDPFPQGMHYALTHWYADPEDQTRSRDDEVGLTQYCAAITADVIAGWMSRYPLRDAPEGFPDLM